MDVVRQEIRITHNEVASTVQALFAEPNIVLEHAKTNWRALGDYIATSEDGRSQVDFPDALILNNRHDMAKNTNQTFNGFYTFDKAALPLTGATTP